MRLCAGESYVSDELPRAGKSGLQLHSLTGVWRAFCTPFELREQRNYELHKAAGYTLESMGSLLQNPVDDPRIVVAET